MRKAIRAVATVMSWTAENDGETWAVFGTRKQMEDELPKTEAEKVADAKKVVEKTLKYYTATNSTTKQESEPEPEENEDDLKQCSVLEEYAGNILSKLIDKVYIYNDGNLQVVFKNDNYFRMVCEEGIG